MGQRNKYLCCMGITMVLFTLITWCVGVYAAYYAGITVGDDTNDNSEV